MNISELQKYIDEVLAKEVQLKPLPKNDLRTLPLYIVEGYNFYEGYFYDQMLVFALPKETEALSILQTEKNFRLIKKVLNCKIILVLPEIATYNRKRLVEKRLNYIVPGKQLYLIELFIDLREKPDFQSQSKQSTLLPSAQFLLIYHLLHRKKWPIEAHSYKEIAQKTGYTAMAITKAVDDLQKHELVDVTGNKEKFIRFRLEGMELWNDAENRQLLIKPVLKKVYVDKLPKGTLKSNESALPEYSDMNPSRQMYHAIDKTTFYDLQKKGAFENLNEQEGKYCLEVWKYNPLILVADMPNEDTVVDPLSLYLCLKDTIDERIEMALEQITEKFIW